MPSESVIPIASRRFARRLSFFYGTTFGMLGSYLPFFPVWLKAVGIEASWIGIITAVPALTRFTILPLVTAFAERRQGLVAQLPENPQYPSAPEQVERGHHRPAGARASYVSSGERCARAHAGKRAAQGSRGTRAALATYEIA